MQPLPIESEKAELRRRLLAQRNALSPNQRKIWDERILQHVTEREEYRRCRTLLAYYPIRGELNLLPIVERAYADGKNVAFPISNPAEHTLTFRLTRGLEVLTVGAYRIPEPPSTAPLLQDFRESLCLVPALSFDRNGFRLGYGGGFYDRFLTTFNGFSVGLIYQSLLCDSLPRLSTDRAVDLILTEKGEIR